METNMEREELINADRIWYIDNQVFKDVKESPLLIFGDAKDVCGYANNVYGDLSGFSGDITNISGRLEYYKEAQITDFDKFKSKNNSLGIKSMTLFPDSVNINSELNENLNVYFFSDMYNLKDNYKLSISKYPSIVECLDNLKGMSLDLPVEILYEVDEKLNLFKLIFGVYITDVLGHSQYRVLLSGSNKPGNKFHLKHNSDNQYLFTKEHKVIEDTIVGSIKRAFPDTNIVMEIE